MVKLWHLNIIYADHTLVDRAAAEKFHTVNPTVKIIYDSDNLNTWWSSFSLEWQTVFSKAIKSSLTPSKEELSNISHIESIDISGIQRINGLITGDPATPIIPAGADAVHVELHHEPASPDGRVGTLTPVRELAL